MLTERTGPFHGMEASPSKSWYFMTRFPEPPLERVPAVVQSECKRGFIPCLKRIDQLSRSSFTRIDLFMVRTAASYYMCWYTMLLEPMLAKFHATCQVPFEAAELAEDYRGFDARIYECAFHSFCPDPCCGQINRTSTLTRTHRVHLRRPYVRGTARYKSECSALPDYPCGHAAGGCKYDAKRNRNFKDLVASRFNVTCSCLYYKKGFVYDETYRMCVDYDECRYGNYLCEPHSVCRNRAGDYYCTCCLGFRFNYTRQRCVRDESFEFTDVLDEESGGIQVEASRLEWNLGDFFVLVWARWILGLLLSLMDSESYKTMT